MEAAVRVSALPDEERFVAFSALAEQFILASDAASLRALATHLLTVEINNSFSRNCILNELIVDICSKVKDSDEKLDANLDLEDAVDFARAVAAALHPLNAEFPEAFFAAADLLSAALQGLERWRDAADAKADYAFPVDTSVPPIERLEWALDAAGFYLKSAPEPTLPATANANSTTNSSQASSVSPAARSASTRAASSAFSILAQRATPLLRTVHAASAAAAAAAKAPVNTPAHIKASAAAAALSAKSVAA